jgi:phage portal protein BeeE
MEKFYTDVQATGNGFLEVGRTVTGEIGYLGHIPATTVRVRRLHDGFVQIIGNSVVYFRNFGAKNKNPMTADARPNEIIHYKEYSPLNTYYGIPDIIAAMPSLIGDQLASQYNIDYFENKAVPRYVVTLKGAKLSSDGEDKMFRFFKLDLSLSLIEPFTFLFLEIQIRIRLSLRWSQLKMVFKMDHLKSIANKIVMIFLLPIKCLCLNLVDLSSGLQQLLSQDRTFKEQVCRPAQRHLEKVVNKIIKEKTDILELKFNEFTLTDEIAQSQILERYVKTQVMTPNEARVKLDLPQRADGDEPFVMSPRQATDASSKSCRE